MIDANFDQKFIENFSGLVVRKDLASRLKGAYPIPTYVLEFLLGRYCSSPNEEVIEHGMKEVRHLLEDHYVDPDKTEIIKSRIRESGEYKILDRLKVRLLPSEDTYWGETSSLNLKYIHINDELLFDNERLLLNGVWGIMTLGYDSTLSRNGKIEPFILRDFQPVQLSSNLADRVVEQRKNFTEEEWKYIILRSVGLEPEKFDDRQIMHLIARLVPFVEHNINYVEFGPRSTGKSFAYRELSPHSTLISGGETSIANLFVSNIGSGKPGLVTYYDIVAFDEVAGLARFSNTQQLQIFKDYMESGTFSRGKGEFTGRASLVFVGNFDEDVHTALQNQHLFTPFPKEMQDLAFLDRFHIYLPGWELPRFKGEMFTTKFGFIVDLIAEFFQLMRNKSFYTEIESKITWGKDVDQRDKVRIRSVASGFLKLLYPDGNFTQEQLEQCIKLAIEYRRRVKEQLRKMGSVEFRKTNLSYFLKGSDKEVYVTTPEIELTSKYSPLEGIRKAGIAFTIGKNELGRYVLYRIEVGLRKGRGTWNATGLAGKPIKEALITVRDYVKANLKRVEPIVEEHDVNNNNVHVQVVDLMRTHEGSQTGLSFFISVLSAFTGLAITPRTIIVGEMTISGEIIPIQNVAEIVLIAKESGAEKLLLPEISKSLLTVVPEDILLDIDIVFYTDPINAWDLSKDEISEVEQAVEISETITESDIADESSDILVSDNITENSVEADENESEIIISDDSIEISEQSKADVHEKLKKIGLTDKTSIVVDGNNVAYFNEPKNSPQAKKLVYLYSWLRNNYGFDVTIFISSALKHVATDWDSLQDLIKIGRVQETPAGASDDFYVIQTAIQNDALILTNDRFNDWKVKYPEFKEEIETRRITYHIS